MTAKFRATDVVVGAFVLAGMIVIFVGIFTIRGLGFGTTDEYHAFYRNAIVEKGTPVKYLGMGVGRVRELSVEPGDPPRIRVTFQVRRGTVITDRMEAKITKSDLLGDPYLDLRMAEEKAGTALARQVAGHPILPGGEVPAGEPFDLQATLDAAQGAIQSLNELALAVRDQVQTVIASVNRMLTSGEDLLSPENREHVRTMVADLAGTSRSVRQFVDENHERFDAILDNADQAVNDLKSVSGRVDEALGDMLPRTRALLEQANTSLVTLREVLDRAGTSLGALDVQAVNDLVGDLDTTMRNLADFTRQIKEHPYRLVRPEKAEPPKFK